MISMYTFSQNHPLDFFAMNLISSIFGKRLLFICTVTYPEEFSYQYTSLGPQILMPNTDILI